VHPVFLSPEAEVTRHIEESEHVLIERLRAGDSSAVTDLAAAYGPRIYQLALRYMKNHEDAEEVAQDVLLKVSQRIDAFRGDAALSSWIFRITFNAAMSRLRNAKFTRPFEVPEESRRAIGEDGERRQGPHEAVDWSALPDEVLLRREMRERFDRAMKDLPPIYRLPIVMRDVEGLSTEEASRVLKVKIQTLKSRLHRGRLILRQQLADFAQGLSLHPAG
jgi:RNA polymerase sigma-70 factor (ECF subfamily)